MGLIDKAHEIMQHRGMTFNEAYKEAWWSTPSGNTYARFKSRYGDEAQKIVNNNGILGTATHWWTRDWDGNTVFWKGEVTPESIEDATLRVFEKMSKESKTVAKIKIKSIADPHLMVIDLADLHIGKLAIDSVSNDTYNIQTAYDRAVEWVAGLLSKWRSHKVNKIMFVVGNDILHIDTPHRKTTSGTPQDTDGMWSESYDVALELYVRLLATLKEVAPVHIVFNPSNHDYMSGYMLTKAVYAWFHKDKNFTWDIDLLHRKYFTYWQNNIGTNHWDWAKIQDVGKLMSIESPDWSRCKYRYIYQHHLHHYFWKDDIGVTIECVRSLSGADRWHNDNGYVSKKWTQAFFHHKEYGQVAKFIHYS